MTARPFLLPALLLLSLPVPARAEDPAPKPQGAPVSYGGIGATVDVREGRLFVTRVHDDGPAAKAGLKVGDRIFTVDRWPVDGLPVMASIARIRGAAGTTVSLAVDAVDGSGVKLFTLTREPRAVK